MKSLLLTVAAVTTSAIVASSSSSLVLANPDYTGNPCTWGWNGVQPNGNACQWDQVNAWLQFDNSKHTAQFVPMILVLLIGLGLFFVIPIMMVFRHCCNLCGSSNLRPGAGCCGGSELDDLKEVTKLKMYSGSELWWTKFFTFISLLLSVVGCALAVQGAVRSSDLVDIVRDGGHEFNNWVLGKVGDVKAGVNISNPIFADTAKKLDSIESAMRDFSTGINDFSNTGDTVKQAMLGLAGPSAIIVLCAIGASICAICHIRKCLPVTLLLIVMWGALIVGCLGFAGGALNFGFDVACGEISAYQKNETGMIKWYYEPELCTRKINFPQLKSDIENEVQTLSTKACNAVADACDAAPAYNAGSPDKVFVCATTPSCTTIKQLNDTLKSVTVKTGVPSETECGGTCTVVQCADRCTNTNLKSSSAEAVSNSKQGSSANNVLENVVYPLLSCSVLLNKLISFFDMCGNVKDGFVHVFAGSCVATVASLVLTTVLFLGQKRYFSSSKLDDERTELTATQQFSPHEKYIAHDRIVV